MATKRRIFWTAFLAAAVGFAVLIVGVYTARAGEPVLIQNDVGGSLYVYEARGNEDARLGRLWVVDGLCASACSYAALAHRSNTCVTPNGYFGIHLGRTRKGFVNVPYPAVVEAWIRLRGGAPADGAPVFMYADAAHALGLRWCTVSEWRLARKR